MSDHFTTIDATAEARLKVDRSEFLGIAFPAPSEPAFFETLTRVSKQHFSASHLCWAFRLQERIRSSDAGEPSGSAGKPILLSIEAAGLTDVGVIVVRWFGGVKLGTGGLARAYRDTAAATLALARRVERYHYARFLVTVPFASISNAYRLVAAPDVVLVGENFGDENTFTYDVRLSFRGTFAATLTKLRLFYREVASPSA
jgi:putative IMPACT (imprinted ancient) family translation regulator